jgi:NADH dehydrogenase FAD-containing subunit
MLGIYLCESMSELRQIIMSKGWKKVGCLLRKKEKVLVIFLSTVSYRTLLVPFGLLVWCTGLAPNPLVESITELRKDKKKKM